MSLLDNERPLTIRVYGDPTIHRVNHGTHVESTITFPPGWEIEDLPLPDGSTVSDPHAAQPTWARQSPARHAAAEPYVAPELWDAAVEESDVDPDADMWARLAELTQAAVHRKRQAVPGQFADSARITEEGQPDIIVTPEGIFVADDYAGAMGAVAQVLEEQDVAETACDATDYAPAVGRARVVYPEPPYPQTWMTGVDPADATQLVPVAAGKHAADTTPADDSTRVIYKRFVDAHEPQPGDREKYDGNHRQPGALRRFGRWLINGKDKA